jgi:hypothetical protein
MIVWRSVIFGLPFLVSLTAQTWPQWGQNPQHSGAVPVAGQSPNQIVADLVYDPFVPAEQAELGGDLVVHYQAALVDGDDVFMLVKTGQYVPCNPPGSGLPFPCGVDAWNSQAWNEVRLHWEDGSLVEKWRFPSDWKPEPNADGLGGWEPVFHPVLAGNYVYVPGAGGTVFKLNRDDGSVLARLNPFGSVDPNTFVAGPLTSDAGGNVYYNALRLTITDDPKQNPWIGDVAGAWLVRIGSDDSVSSATFASLTPDAPAPDSRCFLSWGSRPLPWPPAADAVPNLGPCGSQRTGLNIAPAIAPDGTIYTISRAHRNDRYAYLVAANPDLSPKWSASLRDRLSDGCGTGTLPPNGQPGGCRADANFGVDPATNQLPAGRVIDSASSSPVVAPDGSVLFGAYTRYNYARGHMLKFGADGSYLGAYDFGWDTTPSVYAHDGTYSVILKDNHYESGSYCGNRDFCPSAPGGPFLITSLTADLKPEWSYQNINTQSCTRNDDGTVSCVSDHPNGFEWCINAPAVDVNGAVYAGSEDGNLYVIGPGGTLLGNLFLRAALGAAYTPLSIGPDGRIYAQNSGHLFVVGN